MARKGEAHFSNYFSPTMKLWQKCAFIKRFVNIILLLRDLHFEIISIFLYKFVKISIFLQLLPYFLSISFFGKINTSHHLMSIIDF